ncbi:MAG TPA: 3-oxoacyl-ACP reductase family protein [Intrasporangium sp.]|uniref:SDR family NAD(P)-dependent oxidoreductase n=1 Tax=Intrasporangium sp. TaxID=1925024 RepID=UPI002B480F2E|nr:3-oxoacyl-ACP reductase family protein [Intrasporangium sp.]HKX67421.1 3-oxoacyl-ACP reductase family protein [Intrasporangium sp.]
MNRLAGKIAIVTGAARGLGRGIAERLASEGATVVVTDVNEAGAKEAADEIANGAIGIGCDVSDYDSVESMVADVKERFGRIDVLVNNAGWDLAAPFLDLDRDVWPKIIGINLYGVLNTSKAVLPVMAEQGSGSVVNISSDAGRVGSSGEAVYSAAKGGVIAFTKSTARELARKQVRVNVVCPGPSDTQLFAEFAGDNQGLRDALTKAIPLRRLGQPEDVAGAVAYFASDDSTYVTGQTVSVSGGLTMS